jgi:hypothetical protein
MRLTIDRDARAALWDAAQSEIEGCSDLRIEEDFDRQKVRDLHKRLRLLGPLLDQLGWDPEPDPEFFEVSFDARRMGRFLRRQVQGMQATLGEGITTEAQLDEWIREGDERTGEPTSEEERARLLTKMRAQVDRDLELLAAYRRLLDVVTMPEPSLEQVA